MKYNKNHKGKSGIYCIKNIVNNKVYVGKAKCIYRRIKNHVTLLNTKSSDENRYLINAWHKYGKDNFEYSVLEYTETVDSVLQEREIFWIKKLNALNRDIGYNLREDSSGGLIVSEETRKRLSIATKKRFEDPEIIEKYRQNGKKLWLDEEKKEEMKKALSLSRSIYQIHQFSKDNELIFIWETMKQLLDSNPSYKRHNIYAVCSGEKPSMYGFIWKKIKKAQ